MLGDVEHAVVDRVVEDLAVLLVGAEEAEVPVALASLPEGVAEGAWLLVQRVGDVLEIVGSDPDGETQQRERMKRRTERLRRERGGGRFSR